MTESEDGWEGGSGDEEQSEEGDDEVQVVEKSGLTVEDMSRTRKRKELLWKEVVKTGQVR
jgi:hypothetical protein